MYVPKNRIFRLVDYKFHFSPKVKMAANYAEISSVGKLETSFQQVPHVPFVQIFCNFHNIVVKYQ